ncbi:hypothetical protein Pmar_PMAR025498 [Perkinsus marinus ATCC 50983]|uniref:Uncharacterized protein n=1 Tax=Perkinsus marinus (strain ATCC 50983 / TXsc) TaxID=423536 RepID=C5LZ82_PERM5|nr:hypothetical protein Pmar_PMAR025498 [Perkinsus marinus ATCC 50983]EEQ97876.1 hypothetical protein Pmar_PMAR025498 [Perkinsus marinus ATCC 50983]|eukprot:XP_002765159.1 hypothetical protein Pmar_PMAR025498 [Perkinsus marinus ATCC 50983]
MPPRASSKSKASAPRYGSGKITRVQEGAIDPTIPVDSTKPLDPTIPVDSTKPLDPTIPVEHAIHSDSSGLIKTVPPSSSSSSQVQDLIGAYEGRISGEEGLCVVAESLPHNGGCAANNSEGIPLVRASTKESSVIRSGLTVDDGNGANPTTLRVPRATDGFGLGGGSIGTNNEGSAEDAPSDMIMDRQDALAARLSLIETALERLAIGMEDMRQRRSSDNCEGELSESKSQRECLASMDSDSDSGRAYKPWQLGRNMCRLMRRSNSGKIKQLDAGIILRHLQHPLPETWDNDNNCVGDNPKLLRQAGKIPHPALRNLRAPSYLTAAKMKKNRPVAMKEIEALKSPSTPDCSRFLRLWVRLTEGQRHNARSLYSGLCDVSIDYIEPIVGAFRNDSVVRKLLCCIDDESAFPHEEVFFRALHEGLLLHIMHQCIPVFDGDALALLRRDLQPGGEKFVTPLCKKFVKNYEKLIERGGNAADDYVISVFLSELPSHVRSRMRKYQGSRGSRNSLMDVMNNAKAAERELRKRAIEFKDTVTNVAGPADYKLRPNPPRNLPSRPLPPSSANRVACVDEASSIESPSDHDTIVPCAVFSDDEHHDQKEGREVEDPFDIFCSLGTGTLIVTSCGNVSATDETHLVARDYEGIRSDIESPVGKPYNLTRTVDIKCGNEVLVSPPDSGNPVTLIRPDIALELIKQEAARGPFSLRGNGFKLSGVTGGQAIVAKTFIVMKVQLKPLGSQDHSLCSFIQALIAPGLSLEFLLGNNTLHSWNWRSFWERIP